MVQLYLDDWAISLFHRFITEGL